MNADRRARARLASGARGQDNRVAVLGRTALWLVFGCVLVSGTAAVVARQLESTTASVAAAVALGTAVGLVTLGIGAARHVSQVTHVTRGLRSWAAGNVASNPPKGAATELVQAYRELGQVLQAQKGRVEQHERLLRMVTDTAPMAIVLLDSVGAIAYANESARELFFEGRALEGHNFLSMLSGAPEPFRAAMLDQEDALFTVEGQDEAEVYHLSKRQFALDGEDHTLLMVKHLTREMRRQEVDVWKKMIRVISHELNNSLAPITSLVHSARMMAPEPHAKLGRVFDTIEERARHLQQFVEGYVRIARLPKPRPERVDLERFGEHLVQCMPFVKLHCEPQAQGWFDRSQLEQVALNLLRNAEESGGERGAIELELTADKTGAWLIVRDRGKGMSDEVLRHALLPFYSTKERGTGLGLALCREIVEAHGGKLRIENRAGGGVAVSCWLPDPQTTPAPAQARLTLSRL